MHFVTSFYGDDFVPFTSVCLNSIKKTHPRAKVTILYGEVSKFEIAILKFIFPKYSFIETEEKIPSDHPNRRISFKLKFWYEICNALPEGEVICFLDSDIVVYKNIEEVIKGKFDFMYTYKPEAFPLNAGVIVVKNSQRVKDFFNLWDKSNSKIINSKKLLSEAIEKRGGANQYSLLELMHLENLEEGGKMRYPFGEIIFKGINCNILNQTNSVPIDSGSKIFHYKGGWHPIIIEEQGYSQNRPEETSKEMHDYWENSLQEYYESFFKKTFEDSKKTDELLFIRHLVHLIGIKNIFVYGGRFPEDIEISLNKKIIYKKSLNDLFRKVKKVKDNTAVIFINIKESNELFAQLMLQNKKLVTGIFFKESKHLRSIGEKNIPNMKFDRVFSKDFTDKKSIKSNLNVSIVIPTSRDRLRFSKKTEGK